MRIGPYEVQGELGRGGMGVVFEARSPDGAAVAIKVLLDAADGDSIASFEREKRLLQAFGVADGFVPIQDAGIHDRRSYFVMPLLLGGTLRAKLKRGTLSTGAAVSLAIQLARTLGRAHDRGIVHRDLKPENVLFDAAGAPLVADLGLSKHFRRDLRGASQSLSFSASNTIVGTPGYIAPEQLADSKKITPAADVFALSVMLYECLAGSRPFAGRNLVEFEQALRSRARPLRESAPAAPAWLAAVVARGLAVDPVLRFQDGHAFARALVGGETRRARAPIGIAAAVVGVLVIVAGGLVIAGSPGKPGAKPPSVAPLASGTPPVDKVAHPVPPPGPAAPATPPGMTARALVARGEAELKSRQPEEAASDFARAIELDPGLASAWCGRALARAMRDDTRGAEADASRAIELGPTDAVSWNKRSIARSMAHDLEGAIADDTRAIELDSTFGFAYAGRALLRLERGDLDGAIGDATQAIELDPELPTGWSTRAAARVRRYEYDGAQADATRGLALLPGNVDMLLVRGKAWIGLGRYDDAIADLTPVTERVPTNASAWHGLADARGNKNDWAGAIPAYSRVIELEPGNRDAWNGRGWYRAKSGDLDGGIADCTRALELDPRDGASFHSRGWARAKKGDDAGAVADFDRALELDPKLPDPWLDRGHARARAGDAKGAIADYERFLELAPGRPEATEVTRLLEKLRSSGGR
jgi:tetratricopeptide (TPR) repeat protein